MMRTSLVVAALVAYFISAPSAVEACIHAAGTNAAGASTPVPITQKGHQGLIVWAGGQEELILKLEYESGGDLSALGLVIPVPAVPSHYETAPNALFDELGDWVKLRRDRPQPRSRSRSMGVANGPQRPRRQSLVALPPAAAGPYRIQPMQAFGEAGVTALTEWMEEQHFAPIPREMLQYYIERGWTFLTVKIDPREGTALDRRGGLPPLRVRFAAERALYPLKLEAQGTFPLRLYLITREPLDRAALLGARDRGFEVAAGGSYSALGGRPARQLRVDVGNFRLPSAPAALRAILEDIGGFDEGEMTLRVLMAERFGAGPADPTTWDEELSFPPLPAGERLMGTAVQPSGSGADESATGAQAAAEENDPGAQDPGVEESAVAPTEETAATPVTASGSGAAAEAAADDDGLCTAAGRPGTGSWLAVAALLVFIGRQRRLGRPGR